MKYLNSWTGQEEKVAILHETPAGGQKEKEETLRYKLQGH